MGSNNRKRNGTSPRSRNNDKKNGEQELKSSSSMIENGHSNKPRYRIGSIKGQIVTFLIVLFLTFCMPILYLRMGVSVLCVMNENREYIVVGENDNNKETGVCVAKKASEEEASNKKVGGFWGRRRKENSILLTEEKEEVNFGNDDVTTRQRFCRVTLQFLTVASKLPVIPFFLPSFILSPPTRMASSCPSLTDSTNDRREDVANKRVVTKHHRHDVESKVDKKHPIKHLIDGAAGFFKRKKERKQLEKQTSKDGETKETKKVKDNEWTKDVSAPLQLMLSSKQATLVEKLVSNVKQGLEEENQQKNVSFNERVATVPWGGKGPQSYAWWHPSVKSKGSGNDDGFVDGSRLMTAYLKIMKWPENLRTRFPAKPCINECKAEFAPIHTLEWREKYKPWLITPSVLQENRKGWMYVRGYSPTPFHSDNAQGGFSFIWYRPGLHKIEDPEAYLRALIGNVDRCVGDALVRTNGKVGKCNMALDCNGFGLSMIPPINQAKRVLTMLQDHFPDRLGVLVIVNLAGAAQIFLKMVMPFVPEIVRRKIHILPHDTKERMEMMRELVDESFIPDWLGGTDTYRFNVEEYYNSGGSKLNYATEAEGKEYLETMPYHA